MSIFCRFPVACGTSVVAATTIVAVLAFDLELVHVEFFVQANQYTTVIDDCFLASTLFAAGVLVDWALAWRRAAEARVQAQRLHVLKATMRTVQDIVNNFLNNIQMVHLEAEDAFPPSAAELVDRLTQETAAKLKALGDLESVPEKQLPVGVGIDYGQAREPAGEGRLPTHEGASSTSRTFCTSATVE